ncbi:hypothetical protein Pcinc_007187 [Petrolisthes cinctipes]|uniref:C-type lectin domain-containing protein n=1 Tax=Petrolisthes cinctipes TaxID=88211 RepID=A0AAE1GBE1_PETCI|nr:hypothetical protein Pcinc_007187 [Petrolisthes cinctipes]
MASSMVVVFPLLLVYVSPILAATTRRTVSRVATPEEVQSSIIVNQLALLHLINRDGMSSSDTVGGKMAGMEPQPVDVTSIEEALTKLEEEFVSLRDEVEELQGVNNSSQDIVSSLLKAQHALDERVTMLEETQDAMNEDLANIQQKFTRFSEPVTELVTEILSSIGSCEVEGAALVYDNCSITVCQQGYWTPYQGPLAPNVTISQLEEKNCIVLEKKALEWQDARDNCRNMGGDLIVPRDFKGLKLFLQNHCCGPWFGMKNMKWLDGRPTLVEEWNSEATMNVAGSMDCGWALTSSAKIHPAGCDYDFHSICHIGVQYP